MKKLGLPKGWEIKTIGDVCTSASSNVSQNKLADDEGEFPIYGASGLIKKVSFYHRDNPYLSIVKDGSGVGRITKMDAFSSVIGTLQYILPKENIDLDYLNYSLMSVDFKKYVAGAAIPHIYFKDYKKEPFLWIPLPEQKRIVSILDEAFAAIAKAKANAEQNLKNAKELFESYLQGVFEKKGDGWEEQLLESCFSLKSGDNLTAKNMIEGEFPVFGGNGISGYHNDYNLSGSNVIIGRVGALCGNVRHINENIWLTDNAFKVVAFKFTFDNSFLTYLLNHTNLRSYARQAAQPVISNSSLKDVLLNFPKSIEEQQNIVRHLDALQAESKKLEVLYQKKIEDLEELKKSILQKAFAGEL